MKNEVLKALVAQGKHPVVRLTGNLWDESFGCEGMIARIVAASDSPHDDLLNVVFDYNEHREHNLALDTPDWFLSDTKKAELGRDKGTAFESGHFENPEDLREDVVFDPRDGIPVELVEGETVLGHYLASGSKLPYVEWLEAQVKL